MRRKELKSIRKRNILCKAYKRLLKFVKNRYLNKRLRHLEAAPELLSYEREQTKIKEGKLVRTPCELERKFMDIVHLILIDAWESPTSR